MAEKPIEGLPDDLAAALCDQSIIIPKDAAVFNLISEWQNAPSNTASAERPMSDHPDTVSSGPPSRDQRMEVWREGELWRIALPGQDSALATAHEGAALDEILQGLLDLGGETDWEVAPAGRSDAYREALERLQGAIEAHRATRYGHALGPIQRRPDPWDDKLYDALSDSARSVLPGPGPGESQDEDDEHPLDSAGTCLALLVYQMKEQGQVEVGRMLEREVLNPIQRAMGAHVSDTFPDPERTGE